MKILLFGGTFDPPHQGHMNNLRAAIRAVEPDKVIVMPAGIPPHKAGEHTPGGIRVEMCRCFKACFEPLEVSDWEISREGKSYSIHTLEYLHGLYPEDELYMAVGSDMLLTFDKWYRWQDILRLTALVCTSRQDGDDAQLRAKAQELEAAGGRVVLAPAKAIALSSTEIRSGKADPALLPDPVPEIMEKYHLYQPSNQA